LIEVEKLTAFNFQEHSSDAISNECFVLLCEIVILREDLGEGRGDRRKKGKRSKRRNERLRGRRDYRDGEGWGGDAG
jgi:hypothetical protein